MFSPTTWGRFQPIFDASHILTKGLVKNHHKKLVNLRRRWCGWPMDYSLIWYQWNHLSFREGLWGVMELLLSESQGGFVMGKVQPLPVSDMMICVSHEWVMSLTTNIFQHVHGERWRGWIMLDPYFIRALIFPLKTKMDLLHIPARTMEPSLCFCFLKPVAMTDFLLQSTVSKTMDHKEPLHLGFCWGGRNLVIETNFRGHLDDPSALVDSPCGSRCVIQNPGFTRTNPIG